MQNKPTTARLEFTPERIKYLREHLKSIISCCERLNASIDQATITMDQLNTQSRIIKNNVNGIRTFSPQRF